MTSGHPHLHKVAVELELACKSRSVKVAYLVPEEGCAPDMQSIHCAVRQLIALQGWLYPAPISSHETSPHNTIALARLQGLEHRCRCACLQLSHASAMSETDGHIHRWLRAPFKWRYSLEICTDRCILCNSANTSQAIMYKAARRSEAHLKSSTLRRKLLTCCASTLQKLRKSCSPTKCAAAACMAPMSRSPCCRM